VPGQSDVVAVFAPAAPGHFGPLRALVAGLAQRGATAHVFTGSAFATEVESAGGRFVDLFGRHPAEAADDESIPYTSRYVTFAAHYADDVVREVAALKPSLVVYETFSVIGRVVAIALGLPYVNVSSGHNVDPERFLARLRVDPRVRTSERCLRAVEVLRDRYGIADASPFSYVTGLSPFLNVLCEPEQWLTEDERRVFEPAAFFGSLPPAQALRAPAPGAGFGDAPLKVYASLGTVPWWYWPGEALAALEAIAAAVRSLEAAEALLSLGGADVAPDRVAELRGPGVRVVPYANTWSALHEADVFITAHGANSTHEAIYCGVPMLSYPFFWDQPELAERCAQHGIAVPLVDEPRAPLRSGAVAAGLAALAERRAPMTEALERARAWELEVVAGRERVIDRILALAAQA
jgi:UDP:flavonoid glycosyltransferase YjiC (YdhE family)